jgi:hypothetical protein
MSIQLAEALQQVELETGKTYRCEIRGRWVEVRVLDLKPEPSALAESDVMLEPWVKLPRPAPVAQGRSTLGEPRPLRVPELPEPPGGSIVRSRPGEVELPDVPELPSEEN